MRSWKPFGIWGDRMKLLEVKMRVLALIEELNENSPLLTDDPDIAAKILYVIDHVQHELARMKKIPAYVEIDVNEGEVLRFADISAACGKEVYQLGNITGAACDQRAGGTVIKFTQTGTAQIDCFVYPTAITEDTPDEFVMELSEDALNILPYGVAADLLKSDVSTKYGSIYASRYEQMLQRLDPRYSMPSITFEGGVSI